MWCKDINSENANDMASCCVTNVVSYFGSCKDKCPAGFTYERWGRRQEGKACVCLKDGYTEDPSKEVETKYDYNKIKEFEARYK